MQKLMNHTEKLLAGLFCAIILMGVYIIFKQNLLVSDNFATLSVREVDDLAFQSSIRKIHDAISSGHISLLFSLNDYGYGAFFWFVNGLITYPLHLIGNAKLVIVTPRLISLAFGILSLVMLYKIAGHYTKSYVIKAAAPIVYLLQPEFMFMCERFHTHSLQLFFSLLAFFFALNLNNNPKALRWMLICAAAAIGTKINAIILLPALAIIYLFSEKTKLTKDDIKIFAKYVIIGTLLSIAFYNPKIILFPFFWNDAYNAMWTLAAYMYNSGINPGEADNESPLNLITSGLFTNYSGILIIPILLMLFGAGWRQYYADRRKAISLLALGVSFVLAIIVLSFRVKQGPFAYANYLIPLSFAIPLAWLVFDARHSWQRISLVLLSICGLFEFNYTRLDEFIFRYERQITTEYNIKRLADADTLKDILKRDENGKARVLVDFEVLIPLSGLDSGVQRNDFFNNFATFKTSHYDYILVGKENPITKQDDAIKKQFVNSEKYIDGGATFRTLMKTGQYGDCTYKQIFENERLWVFGLTSKDKCK